jgi:hypothetical protein
MKWNHGDATRVDKAEMHELYFSLAHDGYRSSLISHEEAACIEMGMDMDTIRNITGQEV